MSEVKAVAPRSNLTDDQKREIVLDFLYRTYRASRSHLSVRKKATEIYNGVKESGLATKDVGASLHYLVQEGWIDKEEVTKEITTEGGMRVPRSTVYYYINKNGIDRKERDSSFRLEQNYHGINISNIQDSIISLGDRNRIIVNRRFEDIACRLSELRDELLQSTNLNDEQKFAAATDIETMTKQFQKPNPDRTVLERLWCGVKSVAEIAGALDFVGRIGEWISGQHW